MKPPEGISLRLQSESLKDNSFGWERIGDLRNMTDLPIILKGIHCKEDAELALKFTNKAKIDAIWVSNHGGRQLDTVPASIQVLKECVDAV